jgi:hypothetical protein
MVLIVPKSPKSAQDQSCARAKEGLSTILKYFEVACQNIPDFIIETSSKSLYQKELQKVI